MEHRVESTDRTQRIYVNKVDGNLYIFRNSNSVPFGYEEFRTEDVDEAYRVWQSAGGEYGEFEIVRSTTGSR